MTRRILLLLYSTYATGYHNDADLPVYESMSSVKSVKDILPILLKPPDTRRTCTRVPFSISHNVCFVLDTTKLRCNKDWKCDDMGSWMNNGVHNHILKKSHGDESYEHKVKGIYLKNKSSPDLKKFITFLVGKTSIVIRPSND